MCWGEGWKGVKRRGRSGGGAKLKGGGVNRKLEMTRCAQVEVGGKLQKSNVQDVRGGRLERGKWKRERWEASLERGVCEEGEVGRSLKWLGVKRERWGRVVLKGGCVKR